MNTPLAMRKKSRCTFTRNRKGWMAKRKRGQKVMPEAEGSKTEPDACCKEELIEVKYPALTDTIDQLKPRCAQDNSLCPDNQISTQDSGPNPARRTSKRYAQDNSSCPVNQKISTQNSGPNTAQRTAKRCAQENSSCPVKPKVSTQNSGPNLVKEELIEVKYPALTDTIDQLKPRCAQDNSLCPDNQISTQDSGPNPARRTSKRYAQDNSSCPVNQKISTQNSGPNTAQRTAKRCAQENSSRPVKPKVSTQNSGPNLVKGETRARAPTSASDSSLIAEENAVPNSDQKTHCSPSKNSADLRRQDVKGDPGRKHTSASGGSLIAEKSAVAVSDQKTPCSSSRNSADLRRQNAAGDSSPSSSSGLITGGSAVPKSDQKTHCNPSKNSAILHRQDAEGTSCRIPTPYSGSVLITKESIVPKSDQKTHCSPSKHSVSLRRQDTERNPGMTPASSSDKGLIALFITDYDTRCILSQTKTTMNNKVEVIEKIILGTAPPSNDPSFSIIENKNTIKGAEGNPGITPTSASSSQKETTVNNKVQVVENIPQSTAPPSRDPSFICHASENRNISSIKGAEGNPGITPTAASSSQTKTTVNNKAQVIEKSPQGTTTSSSDFSFGCRPDKSRNTIKAANGDTGRKPTSTITSDHNTYCSQITNKTSLNNKVQIVEKSLQETAPPSGNPSFGCRPIANSIKVANGDTGKKPTSTIISYNNTYCGPIKKTKTSVNNKVLVVEKYPQGTAPPSRDLSFDWRPSESGNNIKRADDDTGRKLTFTIISDHNTYCGPIAKPKTSVKVQDPNKEAEGHPCMAPTSASDSDLIAVSISDHNTYCSPSQNKTTVNDTTQVIGNPRDTSTPCRDSSLGCREKSTTMKDAEGEPGWTPTASCNTGLIAVSINDCANHFKPSQNKITVGNKVRVIVEEIPYETVTPSSFYERLLGTERTKINSNPVKDSCSQETVFPHSEPCARSSQIESNITADHAVKLKYVISKKTALSNSESQLRGSQMESKMTVDNFAQHKTIISHETVLSNSKPRAGCGPTENKTTVNKFVQRNRKVPPQETCTYASDQTSPSDPSSENNTTARNLFQILCATAFESTEFGKVISTDFVRFFTLCDSKVPVVKTGITVDNTGSVSIYVYGHPLPDDHFLSEQAQCCDNLNKLRVLLQQIHRSHICKASTDPNVTTYLPPNEKITFERSNHSAFGELVFGSVNYPVVRASLCKLLVQRSKSCFHCDQAGRLLKKRVKRLSDSNLSRKTGLLPSSWSATVAANYKQENSKLKRRLRENEAKSTVQANSIVKLRKQKEECLSREQTAMRLANFKQDILSMLPKEFPKDSFLQILFEQQIKYNRLQNKHSMKWHPVLIRWCIDVCNQSRKCYESLRAVLPLPTSRTLYDYTHNIRSAEGIPNTEYSVELGTSATWFQNPANAQPFNAQSTNHFMSYEQ